MEYTKLHKKIMRRVYYAFFLRMATHQIVLTGALLFASVYALSVFVHVASIFKNALSLPAERLPYYIGNAFIHTDSLTLFCVALVMCSVFVFLKVAKNSITESRRGYTFSAV